MTPCLRCSKAWDPLHFKACRCTASPWTMARTGWMVCSTYFVLRRAHGASRAVSCAPYCPPTAAYRARSELAVASTGAIGGVPCVHPAGHGGVWCCVPGMQCMSGLCGGSCAPARPLRRAPPRAPPAAHVPRGCCPPRAPQPLAMVPGDVQVWPCPSVSAWALLACLVVYLCGKMSRVTMQRYHRVLPCSPMSH